jgi:hypothetical protein
MLSHLAFAVQVCSRTFEGIKEWLRAPDLMKQVEAWGRRQRKTDFVKEREKFDAYLQNAIKMPRRWSKSKSGAEPVRHPWPLVIAAAIMPMVGESRAWNMPLAEAISLWSARAEVDGDDSLLSDDELSRIEAESEKKEKAA